MRRRDLITLTKAASGIRLNEHIEHEDGETVFRHACKLGLEGIVSKARVRSIDPADRQIGSRRTTWRAGGDLLGRFKTPGYKEIGMAAGRCPQPQLQQRCIAACAFRLDARIERAPSGSTGSPLTARQPCHANHRVPMAET